jgi:PAS domain-containing protein
VDVELILARHLVSRLAVPVLLVNAKGDTLFFNEPAERIFGQAFDDFDAMPFEERTRILAPRDDEGEPLPPDRLPGMIAMRERKPAYATLQLHDIAGLVHRLEATGIPLEGAGGRVLGAMVVLWHRPHDAPAGDRP